jgi:hypothetical protein
MTQPNQTQPNLTQHYYVKSAYFFSDKRRLTRVEKQNVQFILKLTNCIQISSERDGTLKYSRDNLHKITIYGKAPAKRSDSRASNWRQTVFGNLSGKSLH